MKKNVKILIPIYKSYFGELEEKSFLQCMKVLGNYEIVLVQPEGLDNSYITEKFNAITVESFPKHYFQNIEGYNELLLSALFYERFLDSEYILIYQLDAFVFKDELDFWCDKNYDYIGAPWFFGYSEPLSNDFIGVGNSGFSLRKISSMRNAIQKIYFEEHKYFRISKKKRFLDTIRMPLDYFNIWRNKNNTIQIARHFNEDWFVSYVIPKHIVDFIIAPIDDAIKFSFEVKPDYLFDINNQMLPMGCHAWDKYNFEFWKPHILNFGYEF
jgi:hypothetical protein